MKGVELGEPGTFPQNFSFHMVIYPYKPTASPAEHDLKTGVTIIGTAIGESRGMANNGEWGTVQNLVEGVEAIK